MENKMEKLWALDKKEYGSKYDEHLFDLYKMIVETSQSITDKRSNSNSFFLTANTVLVSIIGVFIAFLETLKVPVLIIFALTGIILCFVWSNSIKTYKQLNSAKFDIILEIENKLPVKIFSQEWEILGFGKDAKKYKLLTSVEKKVPYIFIAVYLIATLFVIIENVI